MSSVLRILKGPFFIFSSFQNKMGMGGDVNDGCGICAKYCLFAANFIIFVSVFIFFWFSLIYPIKFPAQSFYNPFNFFVFCTGGLSSSIGSWNMDVSWPKLYEWAAWHESIFGHSLCSDWNSCICVRNFIFRMLWSGQRSEKFIVVCECPNWKWCRFPVEIYKID